MKEQRSVFILINLDTMKNTLGVLLLLIVDRSDSSAYAEYCLSAIVDLTETYSTGM